LSPKRRGNAERDQQMKHLHAIAFGRHWDEAANWLVHHYFADAEPEVPEHTVPESESGETNGSWRCTVTDRQNRRCVRPRGHKQRHRYVGGES
jgi:hypothetical protein